MDFVKNNLMTVLVVAACVAGLVVYQQYFREDVTSESLLVAEPETAAGNLDLLRSLSDLRAVKLDSAVFNDPEFLSLQDFGRTIAPEPVGRTNPFAPLGSSGRSGSNAGVSPGTVQ